MDFPCVSLLQPFLVSEKKKRKGNIFRILTNILVVLIYTISELKIARRKLVVNLSTNW